MVRPRLRHAQAAVLAACALLTAVRPLPADEPRVDFNRNIRPILSESCFKCHGPDEKQRQAGLRLDRREGALATLESGVRAVVPGASQDSELVRRITAADPADRMPPADSGKTLQPEQIDLLRKWVDQGAEWKEHWAFIPPEAPRRPQLPAALATGNPIDDFVRARLAAQGCQPSPRADKTTLVRRVTWALTGLPPTPQEIDRFLADEAPDAYERLVDRLLASPRFGEQSARYWLDVARYGDSHGLHFDNERAIWKYREWVINAYNADLPFDQFAVQQLAGDLMPGATLQQRIATGFVRCNVSTSEGGSINEEVLVRYAVDRTETMSTAFLGLTLGCAVCHDHKFDPISQREFYRLYAYYNSAADTAMDGNALAPPPLVKVPSEQDTARLQEVDGQLAANHQRIVDELAKIQYTEPPDADKVGFEPREFVWIDDAAPPGAKLEGNSAWEFVTGPDHPVFSGDKATRRSAQGVSQHFFTGANPGLRIGEGDRLFAYVYLDAAKPARSVMLQFNDGNWEHRAYWGEDVIPFGSAGSTAHVAMGALPPAGQWVRLEVEAAKVGLMPGATLNGWAFTQFDGTVYWDKAGIVTRTPQAGQSFQSLVAWEAYEHAQSTSPVPQPVRDVIKLDAAQRTAEQQQLVRDYFLEHACGATRSVFDPLHAEQARLTQRRNEIDAAIPVTLVMADLPQPRETHVLIRGQYDKQGEQVSPGVPAIFPPLPDNAPPNRLGLAQWLVAPQHPLTARVAVNRIWQQFFGRGIVKTAEDFGVQGEWPSHPELLDWLAVEFRDRGWDVKRLVRWIVTSETYCQSSRVTPQMLERDPDNTLLTRGPRYRVDAEMVRDGALFVSGLLVEELGGRSVKPYQPDGLWEAVGFVGSNTREYKHDAGASLFRRSMYTFWKRTSPPPEMVAFDAPSREKCVARRARTNTPLQALALLNDEQYVEAARQLAQRMLLEAGPDDGQRLTYGFRLATGRIPDASEIELLLKQLARQRERFRRQPEEAQHLVAVGESPRRPELSAVELAAYTVVGNILLNLDEAITLE